MGQPTYLNISTQLTPQPFTTNTTKQVLLIGQRLTGGIFKPAKGGFLQPDYYAPIALPSFQDGNSALQYMANLGFRTQIGEDISTSFPAISSVTTTAGITSLVWNVAPVGFSVLTSGIISGKITQNQTVAVQSVSSKAKVSLDAPEVIGGVVTAIISSATINTDGSATLNVNNVTYSNGATAFNITDPILLNGIDNNGIPDADLTDPIALMVWDFYQTALSANTSVAGSPTAIISVTNGDTGRDGSDINPSLASFPLVAPNTVTGGALAQLVYPMKTVNLGWLTLTAVGNITLTQGTGTTQATGTLISTAVAGSNIVVTVNVTSFNNTTPTPTLIPFVTTGVVTVTLDNTVNVFDYLENIALYGAVLQFPIKVAGDITAQGNFFNGVAELNQPAEALNGHYGTYAIAGNVTSLPNQAGLLPVANDSAKILVTYPYFPSFGDVVYESSNAANPVASGRIASAVAYMLANGDAPFPALKLAVIKHLPVASSYTSTSYQKKQGGNGNIAINQGWLPLTVNSQGVVYFLQSNTTLITIPNTTIPNVEFSYTHIWDCVRVIKQMVAELFNNSIQLPNNVGSANLSNAFVTNFQASVVSGLLGLQKAEIVFNVSAYANLVTAKIDANDPSQLDVYVPSQIIPQFNGANILINVFSANYVFNK